jgi:hypothetical protein
MNRNEIVLQLSRFQAPAAGMNDSKWSPPVKS